MKSHPVISAARIDAPSLVCSCTAPNPLPGRPNCPRKPKPSPDESIGAEAVISYKRKTMWAPTKQYAIGDDPSRTLHCNFTLQSFLSVWEWPNWMKEKNYQWHVFICSTSSGYRHHHRDDYQEDHQENVGIPRCFNYSTLTHLPMFWSLVLSLRVQGVLSHVYTGVSLSVLSQGSFGYRSGVYSVVQPPCF